LLKKNYAGDEETEAAVMEVLKEEKRPSLITRQEKGRLSVILSAGCKRNSKEEGKQS